MKLSPFLLCAVFLVSAVFTAVGNNDFEAYLRVKDQIERANATQRAAIDAKLKKAEESMRKAREAQWEEAAATRGIISRLSRPRLRETHADLLGVEVAGLASADEVQRNYIKDTKGAQISYATDFGTDEEIWNSKAALLWPIVIKTGVTPRAREFSIPIVGVVPSISLDRVSTTRKPKDEAEQAEIDDEESDELIYRLGAWATASTPVNVDLVGRFNAGFKTDTGHSKDERFIEAELEPLWQSPFASWIGLGYFAAPPVFWKESFDPNDRDTWQDTYLAYQARFRARFITGGVEDNGQDEAGGTYTRLGFSTEINLDPLVWDRLKGSFGWTYLATIHGSVDEEHLIEASLGVILWEDEAKGQEVTLEATYTWGAADNLGEKLQDTVNVALAVLF